MKGKIKSKEMVGNDKFSIRRFRETKIDEKGRRFEKSVGKKVKKPMVEVKK